MPNELESAPSIEVLGQKFSYPKTWQGTASVFFICITLAFFAWTLEPEQINSYKGIFASEADKQVEDRLVTLNKKLNTQVISLQEQVIDLSHKANLNKEDKEKLMSKVNNANKEIGSFKFQVG